MHAMVPCLGCSLLRRMLPSALSAYASLSSHVRQKRKPLEWPVYKKFQQLLLNPIIPSELYRYPSLGNKPQNKTQLPKHFLAHVGQRQKHIQQMTFTELLHAVKVLPQHRKAFHLVNELDVECTRRLNRGEIELDDAVLIADVFVATRHHTALYNKKLPHVLHERWQEMNWTVTDVLHVLLFMSMNRADHRPLLGQIESFLAEHLTELTGNQAAFVSNVFYLAEYSLQTDTMRGVADRILADLQTGVLDMNALNGFLKALATRRFLDLDFMAQLADVLMTDFYLSRLSQQLCMRIITFWSTKRLSHPALFSALLSIHNAKDYVRNKDLERLLTHCTQVQHPLPASYIQELLRRLKSEEKFYRSKPGRLTDVLLPLVAAKVYPSDLIELVLSPFFHKEMKEKLEHALELHPARGRLIFIDQAVSIENPSCSRFRLPEKVYAKFRAGRGQTSIAYFNFRRRSALQPLYNLVKHFCGGVEYVKCDVVLPFSKCPDIEIHTDLQNKPLPHNSRREEPEKPEEHIRMKMLILPDNIRPPVSNQHLLPTTDIQHRKILIRVMMWSQYILNTGQLLGNEACELRLLNQLGYEVFLINPADSLAMFRMTSVQQERYVLENVLQPLKVKWKARPHVNELLE
ncbi:hypothetical protein CAPTEDRAFT_225345 [Capitella teleta]|uniref:Uncharacterized protein n=1 Tax=Capitella teleta TaxID=283909 RepID=R7U5F3_CAPTE|nr:hypothetical protein CAPTEDRAFT_225345 [Capitella teleta]|eukprot:ELU01204.1 hypothetical protein CAPTEDRAFT_225345 [Capitella teleta]